MDGFESPTRGTLPYFGPLYGPPKVEAYAGVGQVSKPRLPAHGPGFPLQQLDSVCACACACACPPVEPCVYRLPSPPGARRPRPGKGSALSLFCFLNATSPRGRPVRVSAQRLSLMWSRPPGIWLLDPRQQGPAQGSSSCVRPGEAERQVINKFDVALRPWELAVSALANKGRLLK